MSEKLDVILIAVGGQGKLGENKEVVVSFDQARALIAGEVVIVPKEPTPEMTNAGRQAIDDYYDGSRDADFEGSINAVYKAMINQEGE